MRQRPSSMTSLVRGPWSESSKPRAWASAVVAFWMGAGLFLPSPAEAIVVVGQDVSAPVETATLVLVSPTSNCSATLVGQNVVLTAASCLKGAKNATVKTQDETIYHLDKCDSIPEYKKNPNDTTFD